MCLVCDTMSSRVTPEQVMTLLGETVLLATADLEKRATLAGKCAFMSDFFGELFEACTLYGPAFQHAAELERARIASSN